MSTKYPNQARWAKKNPEIMRRARTKWVKNHQDWWKKYIKNWVNKNRERLKIVRRKYYKNVRSKKIDYIISQSICRGIRASLKGKKNGLSWEKLVGYTVEDLIKHLEDKFDENMSWDNYGSYWQIDHIRPQSWFKFSSVDDEEFKECWALKNLQPLEKTKNWSKSNRYEG